MNAARITDDAVDYWHSLRQFSVFSADGNTRCWSYRVKQGTMRYCAVHSGSFPSTSSNSLIFDMQEGVYVNNPSIPNTFFESFIEPIDLGDGWWQIGFTSKTGGTSYNRCSISCCQDDSTTRYIGSGDYFYIWGFQVEEGSYPTSYIPTSGATATRVKDETRTTGLGSVLLSEEGTFYAELKTFPDSGSGRLSLSDGNYYNNAINMAFDTVNSQLDIRIVSQTTTVLITSVTLLNIFEVKKVAIRYKTNNFSVWVNGTKVHEVLSGNSFTANTLSVLSNDWGSNSSFPFYGEISSIMNTSYLTDAEVVELTT
jgi:hypothetical protein